MQDRGSRQPDAFGELAERERASTGLAHSGSGWRSGGVKRSCAIAEFKVASL